MNRLFIVIAVVLLSAYLATACSSENLMPGDAEKGCTRMVSQGSAGGASGVVTGDAQYCKYIEKGECPAMEGMTLKELREMCRDM